MQKEERRQNHERNRELFLVGVEARGDEQPELPKTMNGSAMNRPPSAPIFIIQHEALGCGSCSMNFAPSGSIASSGSMMNAEDALHEEEGDDAADDESDDAADDPRPELVEVLQERHLSAAVGIDVEVVALIVVRVALGRRRRGRERNERHDGLGASGLARNAVLVDRRGLGGLRHALLLGQPLLFRRTVLVEPDFLVERAASARSTPA